MSDSIETNDRLLSLLKAVGKIAYTWDLDKSKIEWIGDIDGLLDLDPQYDISISTTFNQFIHPQDLPERLKAFQDYIESDSDDKFDSEYRIRKSDGTYIWVHERGAFEDQDHKCFHGVLRPLEVKCLEKRALQKHALSDELTGHLNNRNLCELLEKEISRCNEEGGMGSFLVVGIDRLAIINEAHGPLVGDKVIAGVGQRLEHIVGKYGQIGRMSGDVFGAILPNIEENEIANLASEILSGFCSIPLITDIGPVRISVSMGSVLYPAEYNSSVKDITTKADEALHQAKERGRGCYVPYRVCEKDREAYRQWLAMGERFINALEDGRVAMAFQPVIDSKTSEVAFYETLIRMFDEDGKMVNAGMFIPAVEELGFARIVDQYTLQEAVKELVESDGVNLSVNVSAWTITDPGWMRRLMAYLSDYPHIAERLIFEITETTAMKDLDEAIKFVDTLKDLGCRVALDDFGAGYTSFQQIHILNVDILKIDKAFVQDIRKNMPFIKAVQGLAEGFELKTVGEGAETQEELCQLKEQGINYIQGFIVGKPKLDRAWITDQVRQAENERKNCENGYAS